MRMAYLHQLVAMDTATVQTTPTPVSKVCDYRLFDSMFNDLISSDSYSSPTDNGVIRLLVQRPTENDRKIVREAHFSVQDGMLGSGWQESPQKGRGNQICVMSVNAIRAISNSDDEDIWAAAGDQIFMDLDLSKQNFNPGDQVVVGDSKEGVILEVTKEPHNGCAKFAKRFGTDALKIVNCPQGKRKRLRGIYFSVVRDGLVCQGDSIHKLPSETNATN